MSSEKIMRDYFGENYDMALLKSSKHKDKATAEFRKKYPYADMSKFKVFVYLDKSGKVSSTEVDYIVDEDTLVDITSDTFTSNYEWGLDLDWPSPWGVSGTVQNFQVNPDDSGTPGDIKVFVTEDLFFETGLDALPIENTDSKVYKTNSYIASLYAAYIATYLCGMSAEHFKYKSTVPNIITSMARYHLYYQMMRFLRNPSKMMRYITEDVKGIISGNRPFRNIWEWKIHFGQEELGTWLAEQPRGTIRNAKPKLKGNFGQVGITYQKLVRRTIVGLDDYKRFIAAESNGLTKVGELLFQQSIESYVYCVLGAQAKTRWPIVRSGARSLQTQEVFRKLVGDTVLQDDHTVILTNMRIAIKTTNVVLNTAVSPGIVLVPSDMIILDKMIPGYNNVLTIANGGMKFGSNEGVNYFEHHTIRLSDPVRNPRTKTLDSSSSNEIGGGMKPTEAAAKLSAIPKISRNNVLNTVPHLSATNLYVFLASGVVGSAAAWMLIP